jgi:hypothetical protein
MTKIIGAVMFWIIAVLIAAFILLSWVAGGNTYDTGCQGLDQDACADLIGDQTP